MLTRFIEIPSFDKWLYGLRAAVQRHTAPKKPLLTAAFWAGTLFDCGRVLVFPVFNSHFNTPLEIKKWALDFVNFL